MASDELEAAKKSVERAAERSKAEEEERTSGSAKRAAITREASLRRKSPFARFLYENGLALAAMALFLMSFVGQVLTGRADYNDEQKEHGQPTASMAEYLKSGEFLEATAENWESEFLQIGLFVVLTSFLFQRGSSESKKLGEPEAVDQRAEEAAKNPDAPWPVRRGGLPLMVYKHSLSVALLTLFAISFALHAIGGARAYSDEEVQHGGEAITAMQYLGTSRFWFESFQNWQSEFMSVAVLVLLSIWLREQGSPQSKPVGAAHGETGE